MGTPLPPNEPGNLCSVCFGVGKTFGDSPTPKVIIAQFQSYTPDQAWNPSKELSLLAPQYLIQQSTPCVWQIVSNGLLWYLWWADTITVFSIEEYLGVVEYFRGDISDPCELVIPNEITTGINVATVGGVVTLSWNPGDLE